MIQDFDVFFGKPCAQAIEQLVVQFHAPLLAQRELAMRIGITVIDLHAATRHLFGIARLAIGHQQFAELARIGLPVAGNLEQAGVPTVPVNTHVFARLAKATALAGGMPTLRNVFVPQPVVGRTPSELRAYIEGTDPVLKQPFMKGVLDALLQPLTEDDLKGATFERSTPRLLEPDTEDNLRQLFIENHWTDYLPIILPTEERVERMLKGTSLAADKIVAIEPTDEVDNAEPAGEEPGDA